MEPHQQHILAAGQRIKTTHDVSSGKRWSRLSLRFLSIIFNIASVGVSAFYYSKWTIGALIMMGPPAIVALLWSCVDVILLLVRHGAHPNACLIIDLVLFLGLGAMSGVIAFTVSNLSDSGYYFAFFNDEVGSEYLDIVLAFGILATLTHLAVSVMACFNIKGRGSKAPRIVYVYSNDHPSEEAPPAYSLPATQLQTPQSEDQIQTVDPLGSCLQLKKTTG